MKEENLGPVTNPDGTPTELTKQMLAGTGRSLTPPFQPLYIPCPACGYELCYMDRRDLDECTMCGADLPEEMKVERE